MLKTFKTNYFPIFIFFIVLLTFFAYFRSLHAPLIFDDFRTIKVSELKNIGHHLSLSYRSITKLSYSLNYYLTGLNLVAFRLTNIIFHIISALLIFYLTHITLNLPSLKDKYGKFEDRRTSLHIALFTATLFLLHPIQTSAVNYIHQRSAIMAAMFSFAGIICYVKGAVNIARKSICYSSSALFLMLAIFSKENALLVLPMLMIYDFVFISSYTWSEFRKRFVLMAVFTMLTGLVAAYYLDAGHIMQKIIMLFSNPDQPLGTHGWSGKDSHWSPVEHILTELRVVSRYIFLILFPIPSYMTFDYSNAYPLSKSLFDPITTLFSLCTLLFILLYSLWNLRRNPLISFGILWYLITISLESFIAIGLDPYFEHRNYLPGFGLFLAAASLLKYVDKPREKVKTMAIILSAALILTVMTFTRNGVWREATLLWEDTVLKVPNNARAHTSLGITYSDKGRLEEAIREFKTAMRLRPNSAEDHDSLGIVYAKKGWLDKAIEEYRTALILEPNYYNAHFNMGVALFMNRETDNAIEKYNAALRIKPNLAKAHVNLGIAYGSQGLIEKAVEHLQTAVELEPESAEAHYNLGMAYSKLGFVDRAIEQFRIAVELQPDYEIAKLNLRSLSKRNKGG